MKTRMIVTLSASALVFGGTMVGCASRPDMAASSASEGNGAARQAQKQALKAQQAIDKRQGADAVGYAEQAVALAPQEAGHRTLLGQAYLSAGRFASAAQACSDALALDPKDGRAALNLVLAQTALGDWAGARGSLTRYSDQIRPADRGLALALAGDPAGGVTLLAEAVREPGATATVRQNLALAFALAGRWAEAKAVAEVDVAPGEVDKRLLDWARFAQPTTAADQVAALLGVVPVADAGQPVALALAPSRADVAVASAEAGLATEVAVVEIPVQEPVATAGQVADSRVLRVNFAPAREIVQALPARYMADVQAGPRGRQAAGVGVASIAAAKPAFADGSYYVQLGAFDSVAVARDAWIRAGRRVPALARMTPAGMKARVGDNAYYRLSVGGFARQDATKLCGMVRSQGGRCFVRQNAGDTVAAWVRPGGTQVASR